MAVVNSVQRLWFVRQPLAITIVSSVSPERRKELVAVSKRASECCLDRPDRMTYVVEEGQGATGNLCRDLWNRQGFSGV